MIKSLKIVTWNANLELNNSQEIKTFIFNQNINILLISETHFANKSYCHIPRNIFYHIMHPAHEAHEKTALIIRSNIMKSISTKENSCRLLASWSKIGMVVLLFQSYIHCMI